MRKLAGKSTLSNKHVGILTPNISAFFDNCPGIQSVIYFQMVRVVFNGNYLGQIIV